MNPSPTEIHVQEPNPELPKSSAAPVSDTPTGAAADRALSAVGSGSAAVKPDAPNGNGSTSPTAVTEAKIDTTANAVPTRSTPSPQQASGAQTDVAVSAASGEKEAAEAAGNGAPETKAESIDKPKDGGDQSTHHPLVASAVPGRVPTPSSRTSTPPLTAAATKKKFSSVSVNKEFLSKAASPVPAPAKLGEF